ncbi:hypothetical protein [Burkholderia pseudomultivorans]|uniref:hypothetical protein n=1 Tax=Burkholderia pseudomultivorans TaxID=1207504 RepID=UPI00075A343A|nr:hypothetical protein [Burkholderia pseudomultivorans]AOI88977.1 hypothetical protein WS57_09275 [Burkholderia pseudomultivorans]KVC29304.1 hypothetical protein WS56_19710 [Burkholderia pseudomultivorans]KVC34600.1 hypothetical protein WS55_33535 [Burkholderia pseudomultivorans]
MAAVLVEYLDDVEPLTFEEVAIQCRIDDEDERQFVENIVIPGARQAAERKSGAAIRKARYVERLAGFPAGEFSLSVGQVLGVDSIEARDATGFASTLDPGGYEVVQLGRETLCAPLGTARWPHASVVTITYRAGIDIDKHPSVRSWMLLAAAWAYDHRELFSEGQTVAQMPDGYADLLLDSITVPPRF